MKKAIEDILTLVENRKLKRNEAIKKYKCEHAEVTARIEELEAAQKNAEDLEAYKAITADLKEQRACLAFLESTKKKQSEGVITSDEKKEIQQTIDREIDDIQNKYAPVIMEKLADLIEEMDDYTNEVSQLENIMTTANRLYCPTFPGAYIRACDIGKKNTDRVEWLQRFVHMYYSYVNTARSIASNNTTGAYWGKR